MPVLGRGLNRWRLRKRFVEALTVHEHPDALGALIVFARKLVDEGDDPALLGEVADALAKLGEALAGKDAAMTAIPAMATVFYHAYGRTRLIRHQAGEAC